MGKQLQNKTMYFKNKNEVKGSHFQIKENKANACPPNYKLFQSQKLGMKHTGNGKYVGK